MSRLSKEERQARRQSRREDKEHNRHARKTEGTVFMQWLRKKRNK